MIIGGGERGIKSDGVRSMLSPASGPPPNLTTPTEDQDQDSFCYMDLGTLELCSVTNPPSTGKSLSITDQM